ncbi:hypothetical protein SAMN02745121_02412 [Nannocystis exedens]|uniref:Uncharacterized protein n=1 Tax=Nannocystis exedens TaxID=54 RepID=A0A1I1WJK2_9BACT|nr:hypothetical protein [Nannocystis exedens]PCC67776.1 hypothetical protein NAEX_00784 [Nannocystis exedens]SFD95169.1 hypothetical protein SAMN02745121_02412 [Nannocystis exedens]
MLTDRVGLDPARLAALAAIVESQRTLAAVARWCGAGGARLVEVITQDEYTHDVVVHVAGALHLVYDTT